MIVECSSHQNERDGLRVWREWDFEVDGIHYDFRRIVYNRYIRPMISLHRDGQRTKPYNFYNDVDMDEPFMEYDDILSYCKAHS